MVSRTAVLYIEVLVLVACGLLIAQDMKVAWRKVAAAGMSFFRRSMVRGFFHWHYSGHFIAALFGVGVAMAIDHRYTMAYGFFVACWVWSECFWLTSDFLEKKRKLITNKKVRKNAPLLKQSISTLVFWQWGGVVIISVITAFFISWTNGIHQDVVTAQREAEKGINTAKLEADRKDTFDKLTVTPIPLGSQDGTKQIAVSIINAGHAEIGQHLFSCELHSLHSKSHLIMERGSIGGPTTAFLGLLGGDRGETADCNPAVEMRGPLACVDMEISLEFALTDQPNAVMTKWYRFSTKPNPDGGLGWIQQSLSSSRDYCYNTSP